MKLPCLLLAAFVLPAVASAVPNGPPLDVPPSPDVPLGPVDIGAPPEAPPVAAPPLDLTLPEPPERPALPSGAEGPPDPLPTPELTVAPPDLRGVVDLPLEALVAVGNAPPFGGPSPRRSSFAPVPEPGTAALLALGLTAVAAARRR